MRRRRCHRHMTEPSQTERNSHGAAPPRPSRLQSQGCGSRSSTSEPTPRGCWSPTSTTAGSRELERRSTVTRLGRGVDTSGQLAAEAIEDVCDTVGDYIADLRAARARRRDRDRHQRRARRRELGRLPGRAARALRARRPHPRRRRGGPAHLPRRQRRAARRATAPWSSTSAAARPSWSSAPGRRSASTPRFRRAPFATPSAT